MVPSDYKKLKSREISFSSFRFSRLIPRIAKGRWLREIRRAKTAAPIWDHDNRNFQHKNITRCVQKQKLAPLGLQLKNSFSLKQRNSNVTQSTLG